MTWYIVLQNIIARSMTDVKLKAACLAASGMRGSNSLLHSGRTDKWLSCHIGIRQCVHTILHSQKQAPQRTLTSSRRISTTLASQRHATPTKTLETRPNNVANTSRGCDCPVQCSSAAADMAASQQAVGAKASAAPDPSGPLLITAGAFVCSCISLQIKLFEQPLAPLQVTAFSSAVAWLATGIIMKSSGMSTTLGCQARRIETVSLLMLRGLLAAATVVCYYSSIESLPLSVAVALFFFNPVFCVMLDAAVTRRRISPTALASCLLTVLGVLIIGGHDQIVWYVEHVIEAEQAVQSAAAAGQAVHSVPPAADLPISGVLLGLGAAAANAAAFVCVGIVGPGVSPLCLTWWQHLVVAHVAIAAIVVQNLAPLEFRVSSSSFGSALCCFLGDPFSSSSSSTGSISSNMAALMSSVTMQLSDAYKSLLVDGSDAFVDFLDVVPSRHDVLLLLGVVLANFCGQLLLNAGFQRMDAGRGSAINTSQVLFGCVWDVALLHSAPSMAMWIGSSAIAAGVYGTTLSDGLDSKPRRVQGRGR